MASSTDVAVEIDADTGETLHYFGHVGDNVWSFDPEESAFWWQHGGHFTSSGTMKFNIPCGINQ